jgi:glycosyltransferase involved in cell wall biosynthesis
LSERPSITVAIPTMNGSRHLPETLRSILAQMGPAFDLLLCDDRSDDGTPIVAQSMAGDRIRIVVNSERLGLAGNWNQCVALSYAPIVAVVHQDDVLRPGHIAAHVAAFEENPSVGLVASASEVIDVEGNPVPASVVERGGLGLIDHTFAPGESLPVLAAGNPLRCSAVSIRLVAHAEVGGFDPALRYVVDWDFWLKVTRRWSLSWRATPTVDVRWHDESETHRFTKGTLDLEETERVSAAVLSMLKEDGQPIGPPASEVRRRLARAYLNRAQVALRVGDGHLSRRCLKRAIHLWPGVVGTTAADPRLLAQMAAVWALPGPSGRWFRREV